MDFAKQLTFEEGIRLIHQFCKAKRRYNSRTCGSCPMRIIPDGCWFKHNPSGWRIDSFLEKVEETIAWAKQLEANDWKL